MPSEPPLIDLLKLHSEEVRFQVQLNWDRAKSSLTFHVALMALIATLDKVLAKPFTVVMFVFAALSAILSARILHVSHGYYRAAREQRKAVEARLGTEFSFVTTPGMRRGERSFPNVIQVLIGMHALLALLSAAGAVAYALKP